MTKQDLILDALSDINAIAAGDLPDPATLMYASGKLDRIYDAWNADAETAWSVGFAQYPLTPNLQPHTIGPNSATFTVAQRPVSITFANIVMGSGSTAIRVPLNIRDDAWWAAKGYRGVTSRLPTDLYYSADWPVGVTPVAGSLTTPNTNGSIFLWAVPSTAYGLELWSPTVLAALTLTQLFSLPPGYRDALTLTLAEDCCKPLTGQDPSMKLSAAAGKARARIFDNNTAPPRIATTDAGIPGASVGGQGNYLSGWWR